jgi:hypothetical protein
MPGRFDQLTDSPESKRRHIVVNILILPFRDQIGFMPNTYIAAISDIPAKARPGRQMSQISVLRVSSESPKGLPVLKKQYRSAKPDVAAHWTAVFRAPGRDRCLSRRASARSIAFADPSPKRRRP